MRGGPKLGRYPGALAEVSTDDGGPARSFELDAALARARVPFLFVCFSFAAATGAPTPRCPLPPINRARARLLGAAPITTGPLLRHDGV